MDNNTHLLSEEAASEAIHKQLMAATTRMKETNTSMLCAGQLVEERYTAVMEATTKLNEANHAFIVERDIHGASMRRVDFMNQIARMLDSFPATYDNYCSQLAPNKVALDKTSFLTLIVDLCQMQSIVGCTDKFVFYTRDSTHINQECQLAFDKLATKYNIKQTKNCFSHGSFNILFNVGGSNAAPLQPPALDKVLQD
jgi:hypothetical protein